MLLLNKLKNKSLPFYYVDLDPKKIDVFKKFVDEASNPLDKQTAQDALDNYKDLINRNKSKKAIKSHVNNNQVFSLNAPGLFKK